MRRVRSLAFWAWRFGVLGIDMCQGWPLLRVIAMLRLDAESSRYPGNFA